MARPKKSNKSTKSSSVSNEAKSSNKNSKFVWKENYAGFILGAIILVAIGILVANYFVKSTNTVSDIKTDISNVEQTKTVTVEKGESLSSIAKRELGDADLWPKLVEENKLESTTVEVGQKLIIPVVATPSTAMTEETKTTPAPVATQAPEVNVTTMAEKVQPKSGEYQVVEGDTLWEIAQAQYGDPNMWKEIASVNGVKYNSLGNPLIYSGSVIKLP